MGKVPGSLTYAEIGEQAGVFQEVVDGLDHMVPVLARVFGDFRPEEVIFTGCGTSYHLAQASSALFAMYNGVSARAVPSSELFLYPRLHLKGRRTLVVPFTRRASTTEVKLALAEVRRRPEVKTLAVSCDGASVPSNDFCLLSPAGDERSIVMTKSFTSMLYMALFIALLAADEKALIEEARTIPSVCHGLLASADSFARRLAEEEKNLDLFVYLGQGPFFGLAGEAAIKMKEMSLANAEAYHCLEYRHGPISLAGSATLVILFASAAASELERGLLAELKRIGAKTCVIADRLHEGMATLADYHFELSSGRDDFLRLPPTIIPAQLLAYHFALNKGLDPDVPRNLTQAVVLDWTPSTRRVCPGGSTTKDQGNSW